MDNLSFSDILTESFEERLRIAPGHEGFIVQTGNRQHPVHRHQELEFNFVLSGTARYFLGDRRYDLRRGSLVWLFPQQDHVLLERSPDYRHWVVVFTPALIAQVCRAPDTQVLKSPAPTGWYCRRLPSSAREPFDALITTVNEISMHESDRFNAGLAYLLLTAWSQFTQAAGDDVAENGGEIHPAVEIAVRLLRSPDADDLSLEQIAAHSALSADQLSRLFQAQIGMTLVTFRNRERIRRYLLLRSENKHLSLTDAALSAGFGSYAQFHRVFRNVMGVSPGKFRAMP